MCGHYTAFQRIYLFQIPHVCLSHFGRWGTHKVKQINVMKSRQTDWVRVSRSHPSPITINPVLSSFLFSEWYCPLLDIVELFISSSQTNPDGENVRLRNIFTIILKLWWDQKHNLLLYADLNIYMLYCGYGLGFEEQVWHEKAHEDYKPNCRCMSQWKTIRCY